MSSAKQIKQYNPSKRLNTHKYTLPPNKSPDQNITSPRNYYPRTSQNIKVAQLRKAVKQTSQQLQVHIQSKELASELQYYRVNGLVMVERQSICLEKELLVISKIQQFYMHYNTSYQTHYSTIPKLTWIVLTNAINNGEIEQEFNQNYSPIQFVVLNSIQDIPNYLNFHNKNPKCVWKNLSFFSKIVNFGNYCNQFASVLQYGDKAEMHRPFENCQLWLLSKHQLKSLNVNPYQCYYLGEHSIRGEQIQLTQSQQKLLYILVADNFQMCLHQAGITAFQQTLTPQFIRRELYNTKQKIYCEKVIENYLHNEIVINLVNFPQEIAQVFAENAYVIRNMEFANELRWNIYSLYYGMKPEEDKLGLSFNSSAESIEEEVSSIKDHFYLFAQLREQYKQVKYFLRPFLLVAYNISNDSLIGQLEFFTGKKITFIQMMEEINDRQDCPIILFSNNDQLLTHKITLIHCPPFYDNHQIHQSFINLINKWNTNDTMPIQYSSTIVTNFCSELKEIQQIYPYQRRSIKDFSFFLASMKQNASHLIVLEMNDYSQERQQKLKEIQLCKNISMEVYLLYGNEFISRNKNNKYTFLKKEQLLNKIQLIITQHQPYEELIDIEDIHQFYSDIHNFNQFSRSICQTYSTPNFTYQSNNKSRIIICIPKGVPYYSLIERSIHPYSLLVYRKIQQASQMANYVPSDSFAVIICLPGESQKVKSSNKHLYQLTIIQQMGEKQLRREVDKIVDRFGLQRKKLNLIKKKKLPTVILYDHNQYKQIKAINKMSNLFHNSKIITMSKKQLKTIIKSYSIASNIQFYQIGKSQISQATKLTTVIQLFQLYMCPSIAYHEFTTEKLQFSLKQLFIKNLQESRKVKNNRTSQITLSRNLSPKSKPFLQKECIVTEPGLSILQSASLCKVINKQKFDGWQQLISLCLKHLSKGKQMIIVVKEQELFVLKDQVNVYSLQLCWIVLVSDFKKCIIREPNIVFCKEEDFQQTLLLVTQTYQKFKRNSFQISVNFKEQIANLFETSISTIPQKVSSSTKTLKIDFQSQIQQIQHSSLLIYLNKNVKDIPLQKLNTCFAFNNKANLQNSLSSFVNFQQKNHQNEGLAIVCEHHNKKFIEQSLQLINETTHLLITLQQIGSLISYSNPYKTIFIMQKTYRITNNHLITLSPQQTSSSFSKRLKVFIEAVIKY